MPEPRPNTLPLPNLDDRRFDDLVQEARARLARHLPELTQVSPGDPVHALVDLFAWLTETVLYRANQIPERQRLAFLNLLQIPPRPARPARGLVCVDAEAGAGGFRLPPLLASESRFMAGNVSFSSVGEVQPTPLALRLLVKETLSDARLSALGISKAQLRELYGVEPASFRPRNLTAGRDPIDLGASLDGALYLALCLPKPLVGKADAVRAKLAGQTLNLGLAPLDDVPTEFDGRADHLASAPAPRALDWDLAWWPDPAGRPDDLQWLPLETLADTSQGGRRLGVARLRLPRQTDFLRVPETGDPRFAGFGDAPPEAPADLAPGQLLAWLRLTCPAEPGLRLGYVGLNAVEVVGQSVVRDLMLGVGDGRPDQRLSLPHANVDAASLVLQVEAPGGWEDWQPVAHFAASGPDSRVYRLDAGAGQVHFGDGVRGKRPPSGMGIRAAVYRHGGGHAGNLPPQSIRELHGGSGAAGGLRLRQDWPAAGGVDAETVAETERRIPAHLAHRDRAVTREDFRQLARDNPLQPVARAEVIPGFLPGASLGSLRRNIPGAVSVFVLPPAAPALGAAPRPVAGLLRDVHAYLAERTLLGTELYVLSPQYQPVSVSLALEVEDPATEQQVFQAVTQALLDYLWALPPGGPRGAGWPLGRAVEINELRTQAGRVAGVQAVNHLRLFYQDLTHGTWQELLETQALPLTDYQLPELMTVALEAGEDLPEPPRGHASGTPAPRTPTGVPVPVIPDKC